MPHQCTDCGRRFDDGSKEMLSGCPNCGGNKFQFLPDGAAGEEAAESSVTPARDRPERDRPGSTVARTVGSAATAVRDLVGSSNSPPEPGAPPDAEAVSPEPRTDPTRGTASSNSTPARAPDPGEPRSSEASGSRERRPSDSQRDSADTAAHERADPAAGHASGVEPEVDGREPTTAGMADSENAAQASARSEVVSPDELPSTSQTNRRTRSRAAEEWSRSVEETETDPQAQTETDRPDLSELREELNQQFESIKVCEPGQYELNLMELFDREEYIIALQEDGKYTVQVPEHWQE